MKRWLRRLGIASIVVVDLLVFASGAALTLGAGSHPRLAVELLRMADADRRARLAQIEAGRPGSGEMLVPDSPQERSYRRVAALDRRHQQRLGAIVDQIGWPHAGLVGDAAAHAAWLLAQHADLDFQVDALARMREHADAVRPSRTSAGSRVCTAPADTHAGKLQTGAVGKDARWQRSSGVF